MGVPTFADSGKDDVGTFDDPVVRDAALAGLGRYNGSVVALDPNTGRVLSIVNQKLAFSSGFIPCSTIKPVIAVAALEESVITRDSMIKVAPRRYLNLVEALAHSNNAFFEELGRRMGFDTVSHYARLMGLGEMSGYGLPRRSQVSAVRAAQKWRCSPHVELWRRHSNHAAAACIGGIHAGQWRNDLLPAVSPNPQDAESFEPRIKRKLDIASLVPDIRDGMLAAVMYGTARLSWGGEGDQPLGKTGTCSDSASRVGWFVSYADQAHPKIVLAVLMRGHSTIVKGPFAAEIAGRIYKRLYENNYFADNPAPTAPPLGTPSKPQTITISKAGS